MESKISKIFDCKAVAEKYKDEAKKEIEKFNFKPCLATILGTREKSSEIYSDLIAKDFNEMNVDVKKILTNSKEETLSAIEKLNKDTGIQGILVFYPLKYEGVDDRDIMDCVNPYKDIEGLHSQNLGYLVKYKRFLDFEKRIKCIVPCTPKAVVKTLQYYADIIVAGKFVTIVNNSMTVGKPLGLMLENLDATVVECHINTNTKDIEECIKTADILITAVPDSKFKVKTELVKEGAIVFDISFQGNIDFETLSKKTSYLTHLKNSLGKVTRAMIVTNLVYACKYKGMYY